MSVRKAVGLAILALWVGTMGWYAHRLYFGPEARRLAEAARSIPPGPAYYAISRDARQIGWAQSRVDTLPSGGGFVVQDRLELSLDAFGLGRDTATVRSQARLGPALWLEEFRVDADAAVASLSAEGSVEGDSALSLRVVRSGDTVRRRVPLEGGILLTTAIPLRLAAQGGGEPGERIRIDSFDPTTMSSRAVTLRVLDRRVASYPDSAVQDSITGVWSVERRDTVRAWRLAREGEGSRRLTAWVDEDGRLLQLETSGGFSLERTAFELAYYGFVRGAAFETAGPTGPAVTSDGAARSSPEEDDDDG